MQSVPITTDVMSLNLDLEVYNIMWYSLSVTSLVTGRWFSPGPPVSSTNKTDCHDIAEILLKVALNTIKQTNQRLSRACIVHLVIKRTNSSYVKTMSCSGSHLGIPINIKNTKFVKDLSMIDEQLGFNQCNSFREEHISLFSPYGPVLILWHVVAAIFHFILEQKT